MVFCGVCNVPLDMLDMAQHANQKLHLRNLPRFLSLGKEQVFISEVVSSYKEVHQLEGATLSDENNVLRFETTLALFESNTSLHSAGPLVELIERKSMEKIGDPRSLAVFGDMIHNAEIRRYDLLNELCFPQYGVTADGTPNFAEWEGVALRRVTLDWEIIDYLARLAALKKSPRAAVLAVSWEGALRDRCKLRLQDARSAMLDRAATNGATLRILGERNSSFRAFNAKCTPHTVVKVGEKFNHSELKMALSGWIKVIMHPGHARLRFTGVFDEGPLVGGGVRWWTKWELLCQLHRLGWLKLLVEVVDFCVENGYSEVSALKLQELLKEPAFMAKVIVQAAAQADAGLPFCVATYELEAGAPMIFVAYEILADLDLKMSRGIALPKMAAAAITSAAIMSEASAPLDAAIATAQAALTTCTAAVVAAELALGAHVAAGAVVAAAGVREGGRTDRRPSWRQAQSCGGGGNGGGGNGGGAMPTPVAAATPLQAAVVASKAALVTANASAAAAEKAKIDWKSKVDIRALLFGVDTAKKFLRVCSQVVCATAEEFLDMGTAGLQAGYDYYEVLYNTPGGELYLLKFAYQGASVFNPLKLKDLDQTAAELLIELLANFNFPEFTPEFLELLKQELPEVMRQAKLPFDWSAVRGAAEYDKALKAKLARAAAASSSTPAVQDREGLVAAEVKDWKDDNIEKARRIWEWWRARLRGVCVLKYWPEALRLVVLVQPSSAKMERIFSQLKLTLDAIGFNWLEKTVEARLFVRENAALWRLLGI
jgi:hypothetical protein